MRPLFLKEVSLMINGLSKRYFFAFLLLFFLLFYTTYADHVKYIYFQYTDGEANVQVLDLNEKRLVMFFVFGEHCTSCNKNVPLWNRIAGLCDPSSDQVFGVSFAHSSLDRTNLGMRYPVVAPIDIGEFKKA